MPTITVIRHAKSAYPEDCLSPEGVTQALNSKESFAGFNHVVTSPKLRTQQTAQGLGYMTYRVDDRAQEYEAPDINTPTSLEYVLAVQEKKWGELQTYGLALLGLIKDEEKEDRALVISHNAVMSAVLRLLTGEITDFSNLGGFEVTVHRIAVWKTLKVSGKR